MIYNFWRYDGISMYIWAEESVYGSNLTLEYCFIGSFIDFPDLLCADDAQDQKMLFGSIEVHKSECS